MKDGPDIASIAALIGDPARANMLTALMSGKALTATELAAEAGVTAQTASAHLKKLGAAGLVTVQQQGRHRYAALAGEDVSRVLEALMGLAAGQGLIRTRTGPRDPALRRARVCYDHLAGEMGVQMFDSLRARGFVKGDDPVLTDAGKAFVSELGIDLAALSKTRRPVCRACLDWSMRRHHLAGGLGAALFTRMTALGWARREAESRVVSFTRVGSTAFEAAFPVSGG